jgi:hypothetical protein
MVIEHLISQRRRRRNTGRTQGKAAMMFENKAACHAVQPTEAREKPDLARSAILRAAPKAQEATCCQIPVRRIGGPLRQAFDAEFESCAIGLAQSDFKCTSACRKT